MGGDQRERLTRIAGECEGALRLIASLGEITECLMVVRPEDGVFSATENRAAPLQPADRRRPARSRATARSAGSKLGWATRCSNWKNPPVVIERCWLDRLVRSAAVRASGTRHQQHVPGGARERRPTSWHPRTTGRRNPDTDQRPGSARRSRASPQRPFSNRSTIKAECKPRTGHAPLGLIQQRIAFSHQPFALSLDCPPDKAGHSHSSSCWSQM